MRFLLGLSTLEKTLITANSKHYFLQELKNKNIYFTYNINITTLREFTTFRYKISFNCQKLFRFNTLPFQPSGTQASEHLRSLQVFYIEKTICNASYNGELTQRQNCYGFIEGGKDTCTVRQFILDNA